MYRGLNCGTGSGDAAENVFDNRSLVAQYAGVTAENLLSVLYIYEPNKNTIS